MFCKDSDIADSFARGMYERAAPTQEAFDKLRELANKLSRVAMDEAKILRSSDLTLLAAMIVSDVCITIHNAAQEDVDARVARGDDAEFMAVPPDVIGLAIATMAHRMVSKHYEIQVGKTDMQEFMEGGGQLS